MQRNSFDKCVLTNDLRKRIWFDSNCQFSLSWVTKAESCFVSGTPIQYCIVSSLANHIRSRIFYTIISFFFFFFFVPLCPMLMAYTGRMQRYYFNFIKAPSDGRGKLLLVDEQCVCFLFLVFFFVLSLHFGWQFTIFDRCRFYRWNGTTNIFEKKSEKTKWFLSFHFFFFFNGYVCCVRCGRE